MAPGQRKGAVTKTKAAAGGGGQKGPTKITLKTTKPASTTSTVQPSIHPEHDLSPGNSPLPSHSDNEEDDDDDPDRTVVEHVQGKGKGKATSDLAHGIGGSDEDVDVDDDDDSDGTEGGWNADEPTLVLPDSGLKDGHGMDDEDDDDEDEDEERTTNEINEMLMELGTKEYARMRKELQEGVQPIYDSLQTLHSQSNKHSKILATHKASEIAAVQALFDAYGTQGPEAFAFTKAYEEQKEALLARLEEAHARKEARKAQFVQDVAKLRKANQAKYEELLADSESALASFTKKADHIGSEKEFNKEVNRQMKAKMPFFPMDDAGGEQKAIPK